MVRSPLVRVLDAAKRQNLRLSAGPTTRHLCGGFALRRGPYAVAGMLAGLVDVQGDRSVGSRRLRHRGGDLMLTRRHVSVMRACGIRQEHVGSALHDQHVTDPAP